MLSNELFSKFRSTILEKIALWAKIYIYIFLYCTFNTNILCTFRCTSIYVYSMYSIYLCPLLTFKLPKYLKLTGYSLVLKKSISLLHLPKLSILNDNKLIGYELGSKCTIKLYNNSNKTNNFIGWKHFLFYT